MIRQLAWGAALTLALASNSWAVLTHRYTFETGTTTATTFNDTQGTAHGTLEAGAQVVAGQLVLGGNAGQYASLLANGANGININSYTSATIEMWVTTQGAPANNGFAWAAGFGRPGDANDPTVDPPEDPVGNDPAETGWGHNYLAVMPIYASNDSRVAITDDYFNSETGVNGGQVRGRGQYHLVTTVTPAAAPGQSTISLYRNGVLVNSATGADNLSEVSNMFAYIGRSLYNGDLFLAGAINEFRIYNDAMPLATVQSNFTAGPAGPAGPTLTINRVTGAMTMSNLNGAPKIISYNINSAQGALNFDPPVNPVDPNSPGFRAVSGRVDAGAAFFGTGDGTFDSDDLWGPSQVSNTFNVLSEDMQFDGTSDDGAVLDSVTLGTGVWKKYYQEEVYANVLVRVDANTQVTMPLNVVYTGGPAYPRSDLDFNGVVNGLDYQNVLRGNMLGTLTPGLNDVQSYAFGDIDGDQDVDFTDFRLFQADYDLANGAGAFEILLASVPEPSSAVLLVAGLGALVRVRRRRQS